MFSDMIEVNEMMLDDRSRKLLQILYHFVRSGRIPAISDLATKTGRTAGQVKMALRVLAAAEYISWDPARHQDLKIIQLLETPSLSEPEKQKKFWEYD